MPNTGNGLTPKECRWYAIGFLFWMGALFLILIQGGGVIPLDISPEFVWTATITIAILGIGSLIIFLFQTLRKKQQDSAPTLTPNQTQ